MDNIIKYIEPHLVERIEAAKKYAAFIRKGKNITKLEDAEMVLRYVLSKHYHIPIFDEYFEKRTIDQLFFEAELLLPEEPQFSVKGTSEAIKENVKEIEELANEMDEWNDLSSQAAEESVENDPFFQMARDFMKTGKFVGEQQPVENENNQTPEESEDSDNTEDLNNDWK